MNNETTPGAQFYCDGCTLIPIDQLGLAPPIGGWAAAIEKRGFEVLADDIGRPAIVRTLARQLHRERAEHAAKQVEAAKRRSAQTAKRPKVAPIPAIEGKTPFEVLVQSGGDYRTPDQEFGRVGRGGVALDLLEQQLADGRRRQAEMRAKAKKRDEKGKP